MSVDHLNIFKVYSSISSNILNLQQALLLGESNTKFWFWTYVRLTELWPRDGVSVKARHNWSSRNCWLLGSWQHYYQILALGIVQ